MSQGNDFANYASSVEDRSSASEDVWFVAVSSDDIKQMNVDQLDEAFRLGVITAQTAVWTEGMEAWAPLGEVADLDSDDASDGSAAAEAAAAAPLQDARLQGASSLGSAQSAASANGALGSGPGHESLAGARGANAAWHNPFEAPSPPAAAPMAATGAATNGAFAHGGMAPSSIFSEPAPAGNSLSMGPSSFAPVTASYAPGASSLSPSTGPVALNVDEDSPPVQRGRRFRPQRWLLAAAGVIAAGVIALNSADLFSASKSVAAAEKQASAAALIAHPYEVAPEKARAQGSEPAPAKAADKDDGEDAPIASLKGERVDEGDGEAAEPEPAAKPSSNAKEAKEKDSLSKEALHSGFAKAFGKSSESSKPAKKSRGRASRASKMSRSKTPSRASSRSSKKSSAPKKTGSAFDPLNGSLP